MNPELKGTLNPKQRDAYHWLLKEADRLKSHKVYHLPHPIPAVTLQALERRNLIWRIDPFYVWVAYNITDTLRVRLQRVERLYVYHRNVCPNCNGANLQFNRNRARCLNCRWQELDFPDEQR